MTIKDRKIDLLVLDAHGVVFTSSFRRFLALLAGERNLPSDKLLARWRGDVRLPAWTGSISESEIWKRIDITTKTDLQRAITLMDQCFDLGHAADRLPDWSNQVPVWMLSNHRSEWLLSRLRKFKLEGYLARVLVSDKVGAAKPDSAAFHPIVSSHVDCSRVLFVDDQQPNLETAARLGFKVLQATEEASWTQVVDKMLMCDRSAAGQRC